MIFSCIASNTAATVSYSSYLLVNGKSEIFFQNSFNSLINSGFHFEMQSIFFWQINSFSFQWRIFLFIWQIISFSKKFYNEFGFYQSLDWISANFVNSFQKSTKLWKLFFFLKNFSFILFTKLKLLFIFHSNE